MTALRLVFFSDLHLDDVRAPRGSVQAGCDADFAAFLSSFQDGPPVRLVLLGDVLDFAEVRLRRGEGERRTTAEQSPALLEDIVEAHPQVFGALERHVGSGCDLDVVLGNHDVDLAWPAVQSRFAQLLGAGRAGSGAVRLSPWIFHQPGVVYAEHGHQHHDINSFTTVLRPWGRSGLETSMGAALATYRHAATSAPGGAVHGSRLQAAGPFLRVLVGQMLRRSGPWWPLRRALYRRTTLSRYAGQVRLPAATMRRLDSLTAASGPAIVRRLARLAVRRLSGRPREDYLYAAAQRVAAVLDDTGASVPCYVFGHTHSAARRPLAGSPGAPLYLNTGTWSPHGRGADAGEPPAYVLLTADSDPADPADRADTAAAVQASVHRYSRAAADPRRQAGAGVATRSAS